MNDKLKSTEKARDKAIKEKDKIQQEFDQLMVRNADEKRKIEELKESIRRG